MNNLFNGCSSLISLDIHNFDTSSVINMEYMLADCRNLNSLDLSNFNTSSVINMKSMFAYCQNLKTLNLSNFITSSVIDMYNIFAGCQSLFLLNINNFNLSSTTPSMNDFLIYTYSLKYLYISSDPQFQKEINKYEYIRERTTICIKNQIDSNKLSNSPIYNCSDECFSEHPKIIIEKQSCVSNCFKDDIYNFEYKEICYTQCPNGTKISYNNTYLCIDDRPVGNTEIAFKSDISILEETNKTNVIQNSDIIAYSSNIQILSTINNEITKSTTININEYNNINTILSTGIMEPKDYKTDNIDDILTNFNIHNFFNGTYEITNQTSVIKDEIINKINSAILNGHINFSNIINRENSRLVVKGNNLIYEIASSNNNNNENNNISKIYLGNCENTLKDIYGIDENLPLIIFKVEYFVEGLLIPIIGYEVFHPLNNSQLNLSYCKNETTNLSIPVSINEDKIFVYDPKSEFYTDDCYTYTTEFGTDILIDDRQNEFINNNMSLCENNCSFDGYDEITKKVMCK